MKERREGLRADQREEMEEPIPSPHLMLRWMEKGRKKEEEKEKGVGALADRLD